MKKESLLWKQGTIFVVLLFCGLAFAPSIHANISKESHLVEITTEVCGLPGIQPQKVQLTQEQAEEVDRLFDEIKIKLDKVKSREEVVEIFNEAIVELDKYGLLGRLSVEQAQKLVNGRHHNSRIVKDFQRLDEEGNNYFCLIFAYIKDKDFIYDEIGLCLIPAIIAEAIGLRILAWLFWNIAERKSLRFMNIIIMLNDALIRDNDDIIIHTLGLYGFKRTIIKPQKYFWLLGFTGIAIKYRYDGFYARSAFYLGFAPIALGPF